MLIVLIFLFFEDKAGAPDNKNSSLPKAVSEEVRPKTFKTFSGKEFEDLYNSFVYPNTQSINEDTPITGNDKADTRIRQIAVERGYKLRSAPVTDTFKEVQKDMFLQQKAAQAWRVLSKKAAKDGLTLKLTAAYRSAKDQKAIFLSRLKGVSYVLIAEGKADDKVDMVLETTALPGYSRHHTGYTVDIACASDPSVKFENSACFNWLNKNNYLNAKKSGWIPSYPDGAGKQGPRPEAWEYVWVGTDVLK